MSDFAARAAVRQALLDLGVPAAQVDEVVDLSFHAADRACATMMDVIARAGTDGAAICAVGVAVGLLRAKLEIIESGQQQLAKERGMPVRFAKLSVPA